jgi:hypothetical protein
LDRCIKITLPAIADGQRKTEAEIQAAFEAVLPGVLGDLLNMVATGLRQKDQIPIAALPRIADSAKWITECGCADFLAELNDL